MAFAGMTLPRRPSHVIFDLDGVLLDTEIIYTRVTQQIVARFGKTFDWSIKSQMVGKPSIESARHLVRTLELPLSPEEYLAEREAIFETEMPRAETKAGALEFVAGLASRKVPMALATSSTQESFALKSTRHAALFAYFDAIVLGDDPRLERGKPAPDIFLLAASEIDAEPAQCLVFEDAPAGVQAALAAGMMVVGLPDPAMDATLLTGATLIASSLSDVPLDEIGTPG